MTWRVIDADVAQGIPLPDASVQTVITSPPYWGLRDYGTATWDGGDAAGCDHLMDNPQGGATLHANRDDPASGGYRKPYRERCGKCGARRIDSQLGLEATPEEYVAKLVDVFREVRRVLRDDGTVWLNLGDSYAANGLETRTAAERMAKTTLNGPGEIIPGAAAIKYEGNVERHVPRRVPPGLKPKDLVGIPWRVAFALQADGWYLRSDIIWAKPNPMPESVTDRPTKSHEYVFLLSKSARYYFDADAVRSPMARVWDARTNGGSWAHPEMQPEGSKAGHHSGDYPEPNPAGRNIRTVWNIATEPFPGAHFATFPKKLVEPCVKAGSAAGSTEAGGDVVLDPFCGSGTVGVVAARLGRSFIGIELSPIYAEMARERVRWDAPLFNMEAEA